MLLFFVSYKPDDYGIVRMGNKDTSQITSIGDIHVKINLGYKLALKNMRHVLDLRLNLLALKKLDDENYTSILCGTVWKLTKEPLIAARGKKCYTLYKTQLQLCVFEASTMEANSMDLGCYLLGHVSEKGIQVLEKGNFIPGIKDDHC